ncbi:ribosomal large subunit pseudouridine synthase D [bacterium BMS3Bbin09]|nr:ribosomal large subunit pseudouridine synthase D [bacterium BMS3Bbin09]HDN94613.1 RluA family pseudouridine synthase [Nitrospirota bacterium]
MKTNIYRVGPEISSERLDMFLSSESGLTRSRVKKLIALGAVTVNARPKMKTSHKLRGGDLVELVIPAEPEGILVPEDIPLEILWEDKHIIVVNKPPGMVVYPAVGNRSGTLMNALVSKCTISASAGAPLRPGIVHRLDKETSGTIVIAKDDLSYHNLISQFKEREIEKHYLALLSGRLKEEKGEINAAIGRSVSDRKKMSTRTKKGKEALTRFEVIERFGPATMAKVRIITGRTHQIRVHFASIGNPVLGDRIYGKKTSLRIGNITIPFRRQMLHAYTIKLRHPVNGDIMEFKAPVPEDMEKAIEALRM